MNDEADFGFAAPPFDATQALLQLKRSLRDLKLAERGNGFELRGKRVAELDIDDGAIVRGRLARRAALTPEWDRFEIASATQQRKFVDELRKRLQRWEHDE